MLNQQDTSVVAFARFEGRGCVHGKDIEDWLTAERLLSSGMDVATASAVVKIEAFVAEFYRSRDVLKDRYGVDADLDEIQIALTEKFQIQKEHDLIHKRLCAESIAHCVHDFDFAALRPNVLESYSFERDMLPEGLPTLLEEEVLKHQGLVFEIHQNDADPFPYRIHGHLKGTAQKIDFRNGNIYKKHELVGRMRHKDLVKLRNKARTVLPPLEDE
jgi:hypothetical protein